MEVKLLFSLGGYLTEENDKVYYFFKNIDHFPRKSSVLYYKICRSLPFPFSIPAVGLGLVYRVGR